MASTSTGAVRRISPKPTVLPMGGDQAGGPGMYAFGGRAPAAADASRPRGKPGCCQRSGNYVQAHPCRAFSGCCLFMLMLLVAEGVALFYIMPREPCIGW
jgi:hypothetical protein